jgi:hypothetical protein
VTAVSGGRAERAAPRPAPAWAHGAGLIELGDGVTGEDWSARDRLLILERIHRYCWGYDERRLDQLIDCFTDDAVWEGNVMAETPIGPIDGREAIAAWLSGFWQHQRDQRRHMILNAIVEEQSRDSATVWTYLLLMSASSAQAQIETTGFYRYTVERTDDVWRINHLFAGFDAPFWPGKLEELSESGRRRHGIRAKGAGD